jgi:catechol 2,3-dioxygenase-like lactoylglutathione lyase family enzyme
MINGVHAMFYSSDPEATRTFLRDVLQLQANDVGGGWLIFPVNQAEVAVHPTEDTGAPAGTHEFSFYCDDVYKTVAELKSRGANFSGEITDTGWGLVTNVQIPGGCSVMLYQKRY